MKLLGVLIILDNHTQTVKKNKEMQYNNIT